MMCLGKIEQRLDLIALKDAIELVLKSGLFAIIAGLF